MVSGSPAGARLLCVVPNPSIDKTAVVDRLVDGTIHRPSELTAVAGGKGLNVARAARTLGVPVAAVLLLAGHAGDWIEDELRRRQIPHDSIRARGETRTCLSILDRSTGRLTEVYEPGPLIAAATWDRYLRLVVRSIRSSETRSLVALSGSLPPGVDPDAAAAIVAACRAAGRRVLVDASGGALAAGLAAGPTVVKVNGGEAAALLGATVETDDDALAAARALVGRGAGTAIVTRGREGAVAWDGREALIVDPPTGGGPHAVGAGDAFLAGLAAGLRRGEALNGCLAIAAASGAASALVAGAGNLDRRAVAAIRRSVVVRRLASPATSREAT